MTAAAALPRPAMVAPVLAGLALVAAWEVLARLSADRYIVAAPLAIARWSAAHAGLLVRAWAVTLGEAAQGFLWGNLAGVALALCAVTLPRTEALLKTLALLVFCLPLVATGPALRVAFGPGTGPQITLAALAVYYTTFLPLLVGLRAAPAVWFDLLRSYGRGTGSALHLVRLPAALPYLVSGLQIAAPAAFLGAMVGEFTGAERGLGVLTVRALRGLDLPATWSIALVATATALAVYAALGWLGRRIETGPAPVLLAPLSAASSPGAGAILSALAAIAVTLALWQGLMDAFGLPPFLAKRPADVWSYLAAGPAAAAHRDLLLGALGETLAYALPGYLAGLGLGAGLALVLTLVPRLAMAVMPAAVAIRTVPIIASAPLIVLALGRGATGTIAVVAVMTFFPCLVACLAGLSRTPRAVLDLFDSYASSPLLRLWTVQVPAMAPAFFAAARLGIPAAILAVTTAEWLATGRGLGALMATVASTSDYGMLWSATATVGMAALLAHAAVARIERRVLARISPEQLQ